MSCTASWRRIQIVYISLLPALRWMNACARIDFALGKSKNIFFFWHSNLAQDLVYKNLEATESGKYDKLPDIFLDTPKFY